MIAEGWVTLDGGRLTIVEHRTQIARVVASVFDAYLARGVARHSVAV
jgi:oxygen-independent coproporphyrinogen-3 oxidase